MLAALTSRSTFLGSVPAALRVVRPDVPTVGALMMLLSRRPAVPGLALPVFDRAAAFLGALTGFLVSTAGVLGVGGGGFGVGGSALGVFASGAGVPGQEEGFRTAVGVLAGVEGLWAALAVGWSDQLKAVGGSTGDFG